MKKHLRTRRHFWLGRVVTRDALIRAFSTPDRSRTEVLSIVAKYIGDSPVPPAWSLAGVQGTFGKAIARRWARHIKHLRQATYRDAATGHYLTPVVQTLYDFGTTPEQFREALDAAKDRAVPDQLPPFVVVDEFHSFQGN